MKETDLAARRKIIISDAWPLRMNAETAAAYYGERHVEDFLQRVGTTYPAPKWVETTRRKFWYRLDLDRSSGIADRPTGMAERFVQALGKS